MSLNNWSVLSKIVCLMLALGSVSLGGAYYASLQMRAIDTSYDGLINGPSVALLEGARANRAIATTMASIYQRIVATEDAENRAARDAEHLAVATFDDKIAATGQLYPVFAQQLATAKRAFHHAYEETCGETRKLADATDQASIARASEMMLATCQPALQSVVAAFMETSNDMVADMKRTSDRIKAETGAAIVLTLAVILAGTLIVIGMAVVFVRTGIVAPIRYIMAVMHSLGRGDFALVVRGTERGDELGAMSKSLEVLRGQLAETDAMRLHQIEVDSIARTQLLRREQLAQDFVARMQTLASGFAQSSGEVAEAARNLSVTAEETSRQAQAVGHAAETAAENVGTVAASSEQMASSIREITGQVGHSARVADMAFIEAEASNARIAELATAASAIGDVVNLIKGIADQTNLLALNATIEAARAGEAGRGFAVVASEVKQLAAQTSRATGEIGNKINEIQTATHGTVQSMKEIARTIASVKEIATTIASAVEEQGIATAEIASNCNRAAQGALQVTQNIGGVGQAAEMTGSASTQLMALSSGLSTQAGDLRAAVTRFVHDLSAA